MGLDGERADEAEAAGGVQAWSWQDLLLRGGDVEHRHLAMAASG